jgi:hypothetical protein
MTQTLTKEKINTSRIIEDYLSEKKLVFYKRQEQNMDIFLIPYRITNKKIVVNINLYTFKDTDLCRMNFKYKLNTDDDFSKELLDMNAKIVNGNLSVESNSNFVTFNTDFVLTKNSDINNLYTNVLYKCFLTLFELKEKNIIEIDTDEE